MPASAVSDYEESWLLAQILCLILSSSWTSGSVEKEISDESAFLGLSLLAKAIMLIPVIRILSFQR